jgi:hypothetical protein
MLACVVIVLLFFSLTEEGGQPEKIKSCTKKGRT